MVQLFIDGGGFMWPILFIFIIGFVFVGERLYHLVKGLASNEQFAGCSVHLVTSELDGGPVLAQSQISIDKTDNVESLSTKVLKEEHVLYPKVLLKFATELKNL